MEEMDLGVRDGIHRHPNCFAAFLIVVAERDDEGAEERTSPSPPGFRRKEPRQDFNQVFQTLHAVSRLPVDGHRTSQGLPRRVAGERPQEGRQTANLSCHGPLPETLRPYLTRSGRRRPRTYQTRSRRSRRKSLARSLLFHPLGVSLRRARLPRIQPIERLLRGRAVAYDMQSSLSCLPFHGV